MFSLFLFNPCTAMVASNPSTQGKPGLTPQPGLLSKLLKVTNVKVLFSIAAFCLFCLPCFGQNELFQKQQIGSTTFINPNYQLRLNAAQFNPPLQVDIGGS